MKKYINRRIEKLGKKKYLPHMQVANKGDVVFINCSFPSEMPELKQRRYFKEYIIVPVAQAMVDIIENEFAVTFANEIMTTQYNFNEITIMGIMPEPRQTQQLLEPIISELMVSKGFSLDGWIRFRLADYKAYITRMLGNLIYEYQAHEEQQEFILLLKKFVSAQKPLLDLTHIIPGYEGQIGLYNGNYEKIAVMNKDEYDDLILGTLLKIVPRRIMIHGVERCRNIKLMNTITTVYEDRITYCLGCEFCKKPRLDQKFIRALKSILTPKKL